MTIVIKKNKAALMLIAFAVVMMFSYLYLVKADRTEAECRNRFNNDFIDAVRARSEITNRSTDAINNLLLGFTNLAIEPPTTDKKAIAQRQKATQKLFLDFKTATLERDLFLEANPLPDLPAGGC